MNLGQEYCTKGQVISSGGKLWPDSVCSHIEKKDNSAKARNKSILHNPHFSIKMQIGMITKGASAQRCLGPTAFPPAQVSTPAINRNSMRTEANKIMHSTLEGLDLIPRMNPGKENSRKGEI
jgi:hypothetical protein